MANNTGKSKLRFSGNSERFESAYSDSDSSDGDFKFEEGEYSKQWSVSKEKLSRYIFERDLPMDEVLLVHHEIKCDRIALWTLITETRLDTEVITCVAHHQNIVEQTVLNGVREGGLLCFLPANLQDDVMNHRLTLEKAFEDYKPLQFFKRSGLWICSSIAYESSMCLGKDIEPFRLMNPKELAVGLVMGYNNVKRKEVLMKVDAAIRNKKIARRLNFTS
ncbi:hypothetical protein LINGRAHAP2_LOCUS11244 [Linum grandiflorum]